jgi:hypothetical protein
MTETTADLPISRIVQLPADEREAALAARSYQTAAIPIAQPGVEWPALIASEKERANARAALTGSDWPADLPLPRRALGQSHGIRYSARMFLEGGKPPGNRLYVMEFQGRHSQHVKFGHTGRWPYRVDELCASAMDYGYALMVAWVSPAVGNARELESRVQELATQFPHTMRRGERFYNMRYETARDIARGAYDEFAVPPVEAAV